MTIIKKVFFFTLLFAVGNCGYEPIYSKKEGITSKIQSYQLEGNKSLNRKIISSLNIKNQDKITGYKLIINSSKSIETVSKDLAGNPAVYKTNITIMVSLMDGDKLFKTKNFSSDFAYNNTGNKFDLSQYQKDIEENLINEIMEKIFIFLTF